MSLAVRRPSLFAEPAWEAIPLRAGSRTHRLLAGGLLVGSLALAFMLGCAWLVDITELKIHGLADSLNDQVGYVTVARNLLLTGELHSALIYPSVLTQAVSKDYLYMPGYYFILAATYAVFGFGAMQSVIPSIGAYGVSCVALFLGVHKLYGARVAGLATALFALFPPIIVYSLTAMVELSLIAAALLAFSIFVYLPLRWQVLLGPLLLLPPLLFRETGGVIAIPLTLLILFRTHSRHPRATATAFALLSAVVIVTLLRSDISAGRPTLAFIDLFTKDETFIYNNAFTLHASIDPSGVLAAVATKFAYNARLSLTLFASSARLLLHPAEYGSAGAAMLESISLGLMLLAGVLTGLGLIRRPRDPILLGTLAVLGTLVVAILGLYFVRSFQALRILLLAVPFECIASGVLLAGARPRIQYLVVGLVGASSLGLTYAALRPDPVERAAARHDLAFVESLHHDDRTVLVAPPELAFDYVYTHYPVRWSFVPANRETLHLLTATHTVGTLVLPAASSDTALMPADVAGEGFRLVETAQVDQARYLVFRSAPGPEPGR